MNSIQNIPNGTNKFERKKLENAFKHDTCLKHPLKTIRKVCLQPDCLKALTNAFLCKQCFPEHSNKHRADGIKANFVSYKVVLPNKLIKLLDAYLQSDHMKTYDEVIKLIDDSFDNFEKNMKDEIDKTRDTIKMQLSGYYEGHVSNPLFDKIRQEMTGAVDDFIKGSDEFNIKVSNYLEKVRVNHKELKEMVYKIEVANNQNLKVGTMLAQLDELKNQCSSTLKNTSKRFLENFNQGMEADFNKLSSSMSLSTSTTSMYFPDNTKNSMFGNGDLASLLRSEYKSPLVDFALKDNNTSLINSVFGFMKPKIDFTGNSSTKFDVPQNDLSKIYFQNYAQSNIPEVFTTSITEFSQPKMSRNPSFARGARKSSRILGLSISKALQDTATATATATGNTTPTYVPLNPLTFYNSSLYPNPQNQESSNILFVPYLSIDQTLVSNANQSNLSNVLFNDQNFSISMSKPLFTGKSLEIPSKDREIKNYETNNEPKKSATDQITGVLNA